jgi:hypothetical protein
MFTSNLLRPALRRVLALSKWGCRTIGPKAFCPAIGFAIMAVFSGGSLMGQPTPPTVQLALPDSVTNFVFSTSAQQGYFYTMESSPDLTNWTNLTPLYGGAATVSWTNPIPAPPSTQFFRARVDPTNMAVITNYHGWTNAICLTNGLVEALIVPKAGRIMQFRFAGATNGPFWENTNMYGKTSTTTNWNTTGAFGGDKSWPSPQKNWNTGGWPPPYGFDGEPYSYGITNGVVTITSQVDSTYQIQVTRTIQLLFGQPVMQVNTVFYRVSGLYGNYLGVWTITQVSDPVGIYVPVPSPSIFAPNDYFQQGSGLPPNYNNVNGLISFTRDPNNQYHLGFDAGSLAWVGTNWAMRIDGPRVAGLPASSYPNSGCSTSVYTNPNPVPYVELECFGPLVNLTRYQTVAFTTTYTLYNVTEPTPDAEARLILGLPAQ